jgi:23S rRNA pseudouridine1911/1915/1917 synthase
VLKRFSDKSNKFTYIEVKPKTGRTHQIRVHMKYINHPVAGDKLYNPEDKGWERMMLHAHSIEFNLPAGKAGNLAGKTIKVESPLPAIFKKLLK